jgi:hypothetical protein
LKPACDRSLTADADEEMSKDPQGILVRLVRKWGRVNRSSSSILPSYTITGSAQLITDSFLAIIFFFIKSIF